MIKKVTRIVVILLLIGAVSAYMVYAITVRQESSKEAVCGGLVFDIKDDLNARFLDESGLRDMIAEAKIDPSGKRMNDVNLAKIEDAISRSQYVDSVECFKTSTNKVCVSVIMRTPVVYVLPDSTENGYFVDSHGNIIHDMRYTTDIVVATGCISKEYAATTLMEFGNFLRHDDFWNNQIEQLHVMKDDEGQYVVECVPRVGDQIIYIGRMTDVERKLSRLKQFYQKAMPEVGWNIYSRLNLEYANQVIGTKRKHLKHQTVEKTEDIRNENETNNQ
ncbi:MAG: hypothetical protein MJY59_02700 [Bacteroidaceae bacterium]|nr:hypothetical protein [Bacteroidaceae bacterium]